MRTKILKYFTMALAAAALIAGCSKPINQEPGTPENPDKPGTPEPKTYAVGDLYKKGFVTGIVVSVDETGEHGLLISLRQHEDAWSYRNEEAMGSLPGSGAYNTACVQKLSGWKEYYPAFAKATENNVGVLKDWFLPSMSELAVLYKAYTGHEPNETEGGTGSLNSVKAKGNDSQASEEECKAFLNKCLTENGGAALEDAVYWSSNESGPSIAYAFDMSSGKTVDTPYDLDKKTKHLVRAMASF